MKSFNSPLRSSKTGLKTREVNKNHFSNFVKKDVTNSRLVVRLLSGSHLLASDITTGKSDPVCFLYVGEHDKYQNFDVSEVKKKNCFMSKVCPTTVDPIWNEDVIIPIDISDPNRLLACKCFVLVRDEDINADGSTTYDDLGMLEIPFHDILASGKLLKDAFVISAKKYTLRKSPQMRRVEGDIKLTISLILGDDDVEQLVGRPDLSISSKQDLLLKLQSASRASQLSLTRVLATSDEEIPNDDEVDDDDDFNHDAGAEEDKDADAEERDELEVIKSIVPADNDIKDTSSTPIQVDAEVLKHMMQELEELKAKLKPTQHSTPNEDKNDVNLHIHDMPVLSESSSRRDNSHEVIVETRKLEEHSHQENKAIGFAGENRENENQETIKAVVTNLILKSVANAEITPHVHDQPARVNPPLSGGITVADVTIEEPKHAVDATKTSINALEEGLPELVIAEGDQALWGGGSIMDNIRSGVVKVFGQKKSEPAKGSSSNKKDDDKPTSAPSIPPKVEAPVINETPSSVDKPAQLLKTDISERKDSRAVVAAPTKPTSVGNGTNPLTVETTKVNVDVNKDKIQSSVNAKSQASASSLPASTRAPEKPSTIKEESKASVSKIEPSSILAEVAADGDDTTSTSGSATSAVRALKELAKQRDLLQHQLESLSKTTSEGFLSIAKRLEHIEKVGKESDILSETEKKRPKSAAGFVKKVTSMTDRAKPLKEFKKQSLATKLSQTTGSGLDGFQAEILVKGANGDIKRTHVAASVDDDVEKEDIEMFARPAFSPKLATSPIRAMQQDKFSKSSEGLSSSQSKSAGKGINGVNWTKVDHWQSSGDVTSCFSEVLDRGDLEDLIRLMEMVGPKPEILSMNLRNRTFDSIAIMLANGKNLERCLVWTLALVRGNNNLCPLLSKITVRELIDSLQIVATEPSRRGLLASLLAAQVEKSSISRKVDIF